MNAVWTCLGLVVLVVRNDCGILLTDLILKLQVPRTFFSSDMTDMH